MKVKVILFKPTGKFYTEEEWRVPESVPMTEGTPAWAAGVRTSKVTGPYDMRHSPDFRRIEGGAVLVPSQEPWGFPFLFNAEDGALSAWQAGFDRSRAFSNDMELPGMWEHADFEGGIDEIRGSDLEPPKCGGVPAKCCEPPYKKCRSCKEGHNG